MALTAGAGIASADLNSLINTTCSYGQAVAALDAADANAGAAFKESATAQAWLSNFLASPVDKRARMVSSIPSLPSLQPYVEAAKWAADTCASIVVP